MARILVVDDAREVVSFMQTVLEPAGHQVLGCYDALDLEERIEQQRTDLLFLDVVLPQRNGFQVLRSLRKAEGTRNLPVILISSKREPTDVEWGLQQGANEYLTKPFTADHLLEVVERHR